MTFVSALADACSVDWHRYQSDCYLFINVTDNWANAKESCKQQKAHLVRIDDAGIDNFLRTTMKTKGMYLIWTGANDIDTEGVYVWEDNGARVNYSDWGENSPTNRTADQDCVIFAVRRAWMDKKCTKYYKYACQKTNQTIDDRNADDQVSVTASGVQQTTTSDDAEQTARSGDSEQTTSPDDAEQTTRSGDAEQTTSSTESPTLRCFCCSRNNVTQLTGEKKQQIISELKKELFVVKANTSASRRKLISVNDSRPSSVAIGSLGCFLLVLVLGFIVVPDLIDLGRFLSRLAAANP
ncbi:sperm receptor for egg jelly-like isoform X2 [Mizuhopecten yessoensis]|uniref:Low affinity immunoglobulin epsilon Fc receptor n=1 Tax=Mizuhopecten yessoensis TaxID=6573 RepID=A0A210PXZ5_MIZYE|nr:sperm receptor for egg jelly-like isoform X2 [Mizuhopecten yessoensis]OWF41356.1 Low affinity immunoglobulin epsilon Fc receptor [Mizuhopecten yessoensis]